MSRYTAKCVLCSLVVVKIIRNKHAKITVKNFSTGGRHTQISLCVKNNTEETWTFDKQITLITLIVAVLAIISCWCKTFFNDSNVEILKLVMWPLKYVPTYRFLFHEWFCNRHYVFFIAVCVITVPGVCCFKVTFCYVINHNTLSVWYTNAWVSIKCLLSNSFYYWEFDYKKKNI